MVSLTSLLVPILVSAIMVFLASSVMNAVLTYHFSDVTRVPDEDGVMAALRRLGPSPTAVVMTLEAVSAIVLAAVFLAGLRALFLADLLAAFFLVAIACLPVIVRTVRAAVPQNSRDKQYTDSRDMQ